MPGALNLQNVKVKDSFQRLLQVSTADTVSILDGFGDPRSLTVQGNLTVTGITNSNYLQSGGTDLYAIFATSVGTSTATTFVQNGINVFTGGTASRPTVNLTSATLTNLIVTGSSGVQTLSATTILSAGTDLYQIFATNVSATATTYVQNGINTFTGGTPQLPTVNITGATLNNLSVTGSGITNITNILATTISANTFISGGTNLNSYFSNLQTDISNKANKSGDTFTGAVIINNNLTVTGNTNLQTITGTTIFSGNSDLSTIFASTSITASNLIQINNKANKSGDTFTGNVNINANLIVTGSTGLQLLSATTILSAGTDLYAIFATNISNTATTFIQNGINTFTAGTSFRPTVNVTGLTIDNLRVTGSSLTIVNNFSASSISSNTLNSNIITSAGTDLYQIFATSVSPSTATTFIQNGINTFTGGTSFRPTVNVTGLTIDNLSVTGSGITNLGLVLATTVSANTLYSANTDISTYFGGLQTQINNKANRSGDTFTGNVNINANLIVTGSTNIKTLSATTILSANTDLYQIFATLVSATATTYIQNGLNTYTGGTPNLPTVNISGGTFSGALVINNTLTVTGDTSLQRITGTTILSGNSDLSSIFASTSITASNLVQINNKANKSGDTFTGAVIIGNNLTVTGNTNLQSLTAITISGGTISSGSTDLNAIFHNKNGYLLQKSGSLSGSTFTGTPRVGTVIFTTPFPNNNYAISVIADDNRTWLVQNKTASGFTINANSNASLTTNTIYWMSTEFGEGFR